ncbi:MAG: folylpolyglutamate synthase/dihydrofolate synthase family protein [bacterium]
MNITSYADAECFLNSLINYEKLSGGQIAYNTKSFDLLNFRSFMRRLGDPHLRYSVIHVAGTKGKGSVCAMLESALRECGWRTGLYSSPHINTYLERISLDGVPISEERFCGMLGGLADLAGKDGLDKNAANFRTVFELLTATAFVCFAEDNVEIAIVETGLGGRLDATNVFDAPPAAHHAAHVNVITAIGLDHIAILGSTIEQITREKAGIISSHAAVVLGPQARDSSEIVSGVIKQRAMRLGCPLFIAAGEKISRESLGRDARTGTDIIMARACFDRQITRCSTLASSLSKGMKITLPLHGTHQIDNLQCVLGALVALETGSGRRLDADAVAKGIARTRWPGRFQIVSRDPYVIIDGAHCALSASAMAKTYKTLCGAKPVVIVAGFMRDKAVADIARAIADEQLAIERVITCAPPSPRALDAKSAAEAMAQVIQAPMDCETNHADAINRAIHTAAVGSALLVFGSFYLVGPAMTETARLWHNPSASAE